VVVGSSPRPGRAALDALQRLHVEEVLRAARGALHGDQVVDVSDDVRVRANADFDRPIAKIDEPPLPRLASRSWVWRRREGVGA